MEEIKSPEEILDEIMNRTSAPASEPTPSPYPPRFDPPPLDDIPPPPPGAPEKVAGLSWASKAIPWLCAALGVTLVLLGACVFRMVKVNDRLAALEEAAEDIACADQIRRENNRMKWTQRGLENQLEMVKAQAQEMENTQLRWMERYYAEQFQSQKLNYLWYMGRFIDTGDYPMAAAVLVFSVPHASIYEENPAQLEQYYAYRQELFDRGYLKLQYSSPLIDKETSVPILTDQWQPIDNPDMAALGILWCALEGYYVEGNPYKAAQYLITYYDFPLGSGDEAFPYPRHIYNAASEKAIQLYQQLILELTDGGYLIEEDGELSYDPDLAYPYSDKRYVLPFALYTP